MFSKLPNELVLKIIFETGPENLKNLIFINKQFYNLIKSDIEYIVKYIFKKYKVDENNRKSLLNVFIDHEHNFNEENDVDDDFEFKSEYDEIYYSNLFLFKKFLKIYSLKSMLFLPENKKIDTFCILPNLEELKINAGNRLYRLPKLENLIKLDISFNIWTKFPSSNFSKLKILNINSTDIQEIPEIKTLEILICSSNPISQIPNLPNLKYLDCSSCSFTENSWISKERVPKLNKLVCRNNAISVIPELTEIETINCEECRFLTDIYPSPNLKELICNRCINLGNLPESQSLEIIYAEACSLRIIYKYQKLKTLYCNHNIFVEFIPEIDTLESLNCSNCILTDIPQLPNLKTLNCSNNAIRRFEDYPKLMYLDCSFNRIESLNGYNFPQLENLFCNNNDLLYIINFRRLETLICNNCKLYELDTKMFNLDKLICSNNFIRKIEYYPNLSYLKCDNNPIVFISPMDYLKIIFYPDCLELNTTSFPRLLNNFAIGSNSIN